MAAAPKTVYTYDLDGANRDFQIPFEYLTRKFIQVTLIGKDRQLLTLNIDYRFTQRTVITTTKAWGPSDGYERIELRRYTSATERLVDFNDGSILKAYDLNTSQVQSLHIAEEGRDVATDTIGTDNDGNLDARGRRIVNVGNAVGDYDAVPLRQVRGWDSSALNSAEKAAESASKALQSEKAAKVSEGAAKVAEGAAKASENAAKESENAAKAYEGAAKASEKAAKASEDGALSHSADAKESAKDAEGSANRAIVITKPVAYEKDTPIDILFENQEILKDNVFYRIKLPAVLPVTLTGDWAADRGKLMSLNDVSLRTELGQPDGVSLVAGGDLTGGFITSGDVSAYKEYLGSNTKRRLHLSSVTSLKPGSPTVDSGDLLSTIVNVAAQNKIQVVGDGLTFYTRKGFKFRGDNVDLCNVALISMGAADAATYNSHLSTVTFGSMTGPSNNGKFFRVTVDGKRELWPLIYTGAVGPEGGGGEDGGMHAWRIVGPMTSCTWVECAGINSGTAGFAIHNPLPGTSVSYQKSKLRFINCRADGNREHGMFADSFSDLLWDGGSMRYNGTDLDPSKPADHGLRGCRSAGKLFGGPFDLESYGGSPVPLGSMFTRAVIRNVDCRSNAVGALVYSPVDSNTAGYVAPRNIQFLDCLFDAGTAPADDRFDPATVDVALNVFGSSAGSGGALHTVIVRSVLDGRLTASGVTVLTAVGSYITSAAPGVTLNYCVFYDVAASMLSPSLAVVPSVIPVFTKVSGPTSAESSVVRSALLPRSGGGVNCRQTLLITGGTSAGGPLVIRLRVPLGFRAVRIGLSGQAYSGLPVLCAHGDLGRDTDLIIDTNRDTTITLHVDSEYVSSFT